MAALALAATLVACGGDAQPPQSAPAVEAPSAPPQAAASTPTPAPGTAPAAAPTQAAAPDSPNLASFAAGARVVRFNTAADSPETAWALLDEDTHTIWQDSENLSAPLEAVIELAAPARLDAVGVVVGDHWEQRAPREVTLEVGDSADGPFRPVASFQPATLPSRLVQPAGGAHGRYLRVRLGARRDPDAGIGPFLDDVLAHGTFDAAPVLDMNPVGVWHAGWGIGGFELRDVGGRLDGCLDRDASAAVDVTRDGRTLALRWRPEDGGRSLALLVPSPDGQLRGTLQSWNEAGEGGESMFVVAERIADGTPICGPREVATAQTRLEDALGRDRRAVLTGLVFAFGAHTLDREAAPTVADVAAILTRHPTWHARLEGHTDAVGDDAFNQALSQRRVDSVIASLVALGIERERLEGEGFGEGRPTATNDTPVGRAQNRRVEILVTDAP